MICNWIVFNSEIFISYNLLNSRLNFLSFPVTKNNILGSRVTYQPDVMKQILDGCYQLTSEFENFKPECQGWVYHFEYKQRECMFVEILTRSIQTMTQGSDYATLGRQYAIFLASRFLLCHLTHLKIDHKHSMLSSLFETRSCHLILDTLLLFCLSWIK
jgi:hypothetical protein